MRFPAFRDLRRSWTARGTTGAAQVIRLGVSGASIMGSNFPPAGAPLVLGISAGPADELVALPARVVSVREAGDAPSPS